MSIFTGAAVAIVTPFNEDCSVNYEKLDKYFQNQTK
jgi:4-hydroxy-tetrahydrodipicolinate synthase